MSFLYSKHFSDLFFTHDNHHSLNGIGSPIRCLSSPVLFLWVCLPLISLSLAISVTMTFLLFCEHSRPSFLIDFCMALHCFWNNLFVQICMINISFRKDLFKYLFTKWSWQPIYKCSLPWYTPNPIFLSLFLHNIFPSNKLYN